MDKNTGEPLERQLERCFFTYRMKCFRHDGTVYKDDWNWLQNIEIGGYNPTADQCLMDSLDDMQEGRTITMYCQPDKL